MGSIVVKNSEGNLVPWDSTRIKSVVEWACQGTTVNPITLESSLSLTIRNKMTTGEIQSKLIDTCLGLVTEIEPHWNLVAGRLLLWKMYKTAYTENNPQLQHYRHDIPYISSNFVVKVRSTNKFNYPLLITSLPSLLLWKCAELIKPERDLEFTYTALSMLKSRYLLPNELPQEMFLLSAIRLALHSHSQEHESEFLEAVETYYEALSSRRISLATPFLSYLRKIGDSEDKSFNLSSCFIQSVDDNLESIMESVTDTAKISKAGGGVGIYLGKIRSKGSDLMGQPGKSGGVVPWIKLYNDVAIAVNQGGKRAGAVTIALDVWHLDVLDFLSLQTETGDQRQKAYDIFPQLVIPDLFMQRVAQNNQWTLFDPREVLLHTGTDMTEIWGNEFESLYASLELNSNLKLKKVVNAKELFKKILKTQIETGMPYLAFKDKINACNPLRNEGTINAVNLCTESYSRFDSNHTHCCNLLSINLAELAKTSNPQSDGDFYQELEESVKLGVKILNIGLDIQKSPTEKAKAHNNNYRTIGVGVLGLADYLAKRKKKYSTISLIKRIFERISYWAWEASCDLVVDGKFNQFSAFEGSTLQVQGLRAIFPLMDDLKKPDWQALDEKIQKYGTANSHVLAIAPNSSTSLIMDATASVLPVFGRTFFEKGVKTNHVTHRYLESNFLDYEENKTYDQQQLVETLSAIQTYIDTGISGELLFNLNDEKVTGKYIADTVLKAWSSGLKTVYYVRTVQKSSLDDKECGVCAN